MDSLAAMPQVCCKLSGIVTEAGSPPDMDGVGRVADMVLQAFGPDRVIFGSDCNEFTFAQPLKDLLSESGLVDIDEAAGINPLERYTYIFEMNSQELDHFFVCEKIAGRSPKVDHVHVNTWVSLADEVSDHDPSVAQN